MLIVNRFEEDSGHLIRICAHTSWTIHNRTDCRSTRDILGHVSPAVLICEQFLPDGSWKDLLEDVGTGIAAPRLIVTSCYSGEDFWAEVLDHGGYDVLVKPFDPVEVLRVVGSAFLSWQASRDWENRRILRKNR